MAFKFKKGEKVIVIAGDNKGVTGVITHSLPKENKVVVAGVNIVKKHIKPNKFYPEGGVVQFEKPIDASNVMHVDPRVGKATKVAYKTEDGKKVKFSKISNEIIRAEV